jgi:hypothetical protein
MGAGVPTPELLHRTRSLIAALFAALCWLAVPAGAAALPADVEVPATAPAPVPAQLPAPTADVAAAGAALDATAADVSSSVERIVTGSAEAVSGAGETAQPTVESALPAVTAAPSPPPAAESASPAASRRGRTPAARAARIGKGSRRDASKERIVEARRPSDSPSGQGRSESLPTAPIAVADASTPEHGASPAGSLQAAPERAPILDLLSGAGGGSSSASGASSSLLFGGLAVLLTALCLAGPALRRRLPSRSAMSWPAAFIPLLERPG